jgi:DNA-directed RNA polymerase subunit H (RpoH/RPB5)
MESSKPIKQNLVQVIMNDSQIKEQVLINLLKMLNARNIVDSNHIQTYAQLAHTNIDQNDETGFDLSDQESEKLGVKRVIVKFISRKLTTIRKVVDIEDFMDKPEYKFVIVDNVAPKAHKQFVEYKNTEVFYKVELQINLIDHILVPKHFKLTPFEIEQLQDTYQFETKNAKRMAIDDPISRYYKAQIGDIFRIERPSVSAGFAIDYRVVINSSIYK